MAAPTLYQDEHGYTVTGGVDALQIVPPGKMIHVRSFTFVPNGAGSNVTIKDGSAKRVVHTMKAGAETNVHEYFGKLGKKFNGMTVTLSNASDILYIQLD